MYHSQLIEKGGYKLADNQWDLHNNLPYFCIDTQTKTLLLMNCAPNDNATLELLLRKADIQYSHKWK